MKEMTRKEFLKLTGASTALLAMSHIIPTSAYADTSKIDAPSAGMYISEVVDLSGLSPVEQEKILTERNIPYDSTITYEKIVVERPAARDSYKGVPYRFQITYGNKPVKNERRSVVSPAAAAVLDRGVNILIGLTKPYIWIPFTASGLTPSQIFIYSDPSQYASTNIYESAEFLDRWVQTVRKGIPMVVSDAEATKEAYPAEYNLYQRLGIRSVIAVSLEPRPVALLAVRNPKRYIQQTSMLRILAYVLLASYNEQKMLNRLQMAYIPTSIQSSKDIYVSLFGELSISTSKGVLKEADFSSPRISRLISYLLISRKNAISPQEITQTLWPDDSDNPAKNVKGLIYRLRQKFSLISDEPLILSSASGYQLNPELHIMTDYQRFDELVSSAARASSVINKVDILKNALDLYHGKVLSSADGEHWLIQFSTKYHLSYMGAVSELLKQLDSLHSYDLLNQYAMKSLTIAPDNPKAYCWLIRSLKAQGMNELATNELAAAKEHLTTEEYEEILAFGANW